MTSAQHNYTDLRSLGLRLEWQGITCNFLGWGVYEPKWWRNYQHTHSYFEICYVFSGSGRFNINQKRLDVGPYDLFVARPMDLHEIITVNGEELGIVFWSFTLTPQPHYEGQSEIAKLLQMFSENRDVVAHRPDLLPMTQAFTQELSRLSTAFRFGLNAIAQILLLNTARAFCPAEDAATDAPVLQNRQAALVQEMVRFLQDNYHRPLLLRDVAAQFHLSERHINRLFKQSTGQPIMGYLKHLRIDRAKKLLLLEEMKVGEIAVAVGVEDVRYFSTLFRQQTGMTPTQYRDAKGTRFTE